MARDKSKCLNLIEKLQEIDARSWVLTAKICSDEEVDYKTEKWFQVGLVKFSEIDWTKEVDRFHLNNVGAQEALAEFGRSNF